MTDAVKVPVLALSVTDVVRLLRSSAYAQILQSRTRVDWQPEKGGIRNVYAALQGLFGTPGTAEVVLPDMGRAQEEVTRLTIRRVDAFFDKCERGPAAAAAYLAAMQSVRQDALAFHRETFADTMALNREIADAWGIGIQRLNNVQLASTLVVKAGSALVPGLGTLAVDMGFSLAVKTLPSLLNADQGKAISLVDETGKVVGPEIGSRIGEKVVDAINGRSTEAELQQALRRMERADSKLSETLERIARRRQEIASGVGGHRAKDSLKALSSHVPRHVERLDSAQKGVLKSGALRLAAKGVGLIFLARDIMEEFERHAKTQAAARN